VIVELIAGGLTVAGAGVAVTWPSRDRLVRRRLRDQFVVTLKDGQAFHGVLFEADGRSFVLRDARVVVADGARHVPVDGELLVARADVAYMQKVGVG
jgi:hypothetical protein